MFQRYLILTRIGTGGMGEVFLGIQRGAVDFQRLIVLKQIHAHLFDQPVQKQMFVDEASLIASLDHPHIVKIIDFRQTDTAFFIVMEYVDGETLKFIRSSCRKKQIPLPYPLACKLIIEACEALHYAHNATSRQGKPLNIIHRDIGLHNLMIDRNGYIKVIDFGIAKSDLQTDKTHPGFLKGNPGYMAPDLFRYSKIDNRVDIYGLGLCLYELLTLRRAYNFDKNVELAQIIHQVTTNELPPPSSLVPSLPSELDTIITKATAADRDRRYQSAMEFASDLKGIATRNAREFEEHDVKDWFNSNFSDQIQDRIRFEQGVLDSAKNATENKCISINSYSPPPSGSSLSSLDPISGVGFLTPLSGNVKAKSRFWMIIAGLSLFLLLSIAAAVLLVNRSTSSAGEKADEFNLTIKSNPPGADVFIDGQRIGIVIEEGSAFWISPDKKHRINLKKEGFKDYSTVISVPKDSRQHIDILLNPEKVLPATVTEAVVSPTPTVDPSTKPMDFPVIDEEESAPAKISHKKKGKKHSGIQEEELDSSPLIETVQPKAEVPMLDNPKKNEIPLLDDEHKKPGSAVPLI